MSLPTYFAVAFKKDSSFEGLYDVAYNSRPPDLFNSFEEALNRIDDLSSGLRNQCEVVTVQVILGSGSVDVQKILENYEEISERLKKVEAGLDATQLTFDGLARKMFVPNKPHFGYGGKIMNRDEWIVFSYGVSDDSGEAHPAVYFGSHLQYDPDLYVIPSRREEIPEKATHIVWFEK